MYSKTRDIIYEISIILLVAFGMICACSISLDPKKEDDGYIKLSDDINSVYWRPIMDSSEVTITIRQDSKIYNITGKPIPQ